MNHWKQFVRAFAARCWSVALVLMLLASTIVRAGDLERSFTRLLNQAAVKRALEAAQSDHAQRIADQKTITQIPAPSYKERKRGEYVLQRWKELGLQNVHMDSVGNVIAERKGTASATAPKLVVAAHLDTVFPDGTDLTIKEEGGKLYAPGIGDDGAGLAALFSMIRSLKAANLQTAGDVLFVANVCEEGLGDLRGVKTLFKDMRDIDGFISIDGANTDHLVYHATGSRRFEITFKGPGGHSWSAFGAPSAVHALGRAIAKIADVKTPSERTPNAARTTFTVGTIKGGTSVNTISASATMVIDMRSNNAKELAEVEATILALCNDAAREENTRWKSDRIKVEIKLVGDRPAGVQPAALAIVQAAKLSLSALNLPADNNEPASSTDANLPISLGIPGITIGGGGVTDGSHTLEEWFDPKDAHRGVQRALLLTLALVGVDAGANAGSEANVAPALEKRAPRK